MKTQLITSCSQQLTLGREIARGGEGAIFEVAGEPGLVAKCYLRPVQREKAEKLAVMATAASPELLKFTAWPTATLHERPHGDVVGIVMRRVTGHREIHQLYGPAHRRVHYPKADWSFLAHVAMNCAAAFESVHAKGHVVGDVNQSGVLVSSQGTVFLIDCDSFQVRHQGRVFRCNVGVPLFTPPELQGRDFSSVDRAETHDCFGLAILIFHLLFMGRHPFAGRFSGTRDMPIERAIADGLFAFSSSVSQHVRPPPHSLPLTAIAAPLPMMFERAFANPAGGMTRPSAHEWREALASFKTKLTKCTEDPAHLFPIGQSHCVWCQIEEAGGPAFFSSVTTLLDFDGNFDLAGLWQTIESVKEPPAGPLPRPAAADNRCAAMLSVPDNVAAFRRQT